MLAGPLRSASTAAGRRARLAERQTGTGASPSRHTDAAKRQWPDRCTGQARKSQAAWAGRDECDCPDGGRHPRCPRGRRPHAPSWGDIEPAGFLRVVCDVTTFVLSGFVADDRARLSVFAIFIASGLGIQSAASNGYASGRQMQGRAASAALPALRTSARSGGGGVRSSGRANCCMSAQNGRGCRCP